MWGASRTRRSWRVPRYRPTTRMCSCGDGGGDGDDGGGGGGDVGSSDGGAGGDDDPRPW